MTIRYTELLKNGDFKTFKHTVNQRLDQHIAEYIEPKVNEHKTQIGMELGKQILRLKRGR